MRKVIYSCEKEDCKRQTSEHGIENWLSIFTTDNENSLGVRNGLENHRLETLSRYDSIHFCSRKCFINYFFKEETTDGNQDQA